MKIIKKNKASARSGQPIHLQFNHPTAKAVFVAGSFNDWRPDATPMISVGAGRWIKELVLSPGTYEYRLIVDGQWMTDPLAARTAPNPFGGLNSVLTVPAPGTAQVQSAAGAKPASETGKIGMARAAA